MLNLCINLKDSNRNFEYWHGVVRLDYFVVTLEYTIVPISLSIITTPRKN